MVKTFLSLGSNIGDRERYLEMAIREIEKDFKVLKKSSIFETEPMYFKDQNNFLNQVLLIETEKDVFEVFKRIKEIERKLGRKKRIRFGPREIDIDILYYGDKILKTEELQIPHPGIYERKFVLYPLSEIAEDFVDPFLKKDIKTLKKEIEEKEEKVVLWK